MAKHHQRTQQQLAREIRDNQARVAAELETLYYYQVNWIDKLDGLRRLLAANFATPLSAGSILNGPRRVRARPLGRPSLDRLAERSPGMIQLHVTP